MISLLSRCTIQSIKPESSVASISVENTEIEEAKLSITPKQSRVSNVEVDLGDQDENTFDSSGDEDSLDFIDEENDLGDEYEEIVFYDDFDKEYWSGSEDNYLED